MVKSNDMTLTNFKRGIQFLLFGSLVFSVFACSPKKKKTCGAGGNLLECASQLTPDTGGALALSPLNSEILVNRQLTLSATGGTSPYTFSIQSGSIGQISTDGIFSSTLSGISTVVVTDAAGIITTASISIYDDLVLSSTASTVATDGTLNFSHNGGVPPVSYSVTSGGGSISLSGLYTAGSSTGTSVVTATDKNGNTNSLSITVYQPLNVAINSLNVLVSGTATISYTGGLAPVTFAILSGGTYGGVGSSTGLFTAANLSGPVVVRLTDSSGATADVNINVYEPLGISPSSTSIYVTATENFSATGGVLPYTYSIVGGGIRINSTTGEYTAPSSATTEFVRVTDAVGNTSNATVTINAAPTNVAISPSSKSLIVNQTQTFSGIGGIPPFSFAKVNNGLCASSVGSVNSSTGVYSSSSAGCAVIEITDSAGSPTTSQALVNIYDALAISSPSLHLVTGSTQTITSSGGIGAIGFSIITSGTDASINSSTGDFTAPSTAGSIIVRATDSVGNTDQITLTIVDPVQILPSSAELVINESVTFSATGGSGSYTFSLVSGGGSISSSTGVYTAGNTSGAATVSVTDSYGFNANGTITVNSALSISPSTASISTLSTQTFSSSGGVGSKSFSIVSGPGSPSINSTSGQLTAGSSAGTIVVRVTDSASPTPHTADATVTVSSMSLSTTSWDLVETESKDFTVSGGTAPFTYSITTGNGSLNETSNSSGLFTYTSAAIAETVTILVADSNANQVSATVYVHNPISINPATVSTNLSGTLSFSGSGGVPPLTYSIVSGGGSLSGNNFTAPSSNATVVVRVTDSASPTAHTADATVTVSNTLTLNTPSNYVATDGSLLFTASGGSGSYTYSVANGGAQGAYELDSGTPCYSGCSGDYTAPSSAVSATVTVTDGVGATANKVITVYAPLAISPSTLLLAVNGTQTFTSTGGSGAKTFSVVSGLGTIDSSTGAYTASVTAGSVVIRVSDAIGNTADSSVTVSSALAISPTTATISTNSTKTFTSVNGPSPIYSVFSGLGSITGGNVFNAASSAGTSIVRVTDSGSNTADATVTVVSPKRIVSGTYNTCIIFSNDMVRCWGDGSKGQLANNSTSVAISDSTTAGHKLGNDNNYGGSTSSFLDFGSGITVKDLALGSYHMCAVLSTDAVRCWGDNSKGQLGIDSTTGVGQGGATLALKDASNVNLGVGRTAKRVYASGMSSCAILDDDSLKCWGYNRTGQLGQGNTNIYGNSTATTGTSLSMSVLNAINVGSGLTVKDVAMMASSSSLTSTTALYTTCALLSNDSLSCWGDNTYAQLGQGTSGTTPTNSPTTNYVNLGTNLVAKSIYAGRYTFCAIIHDTAGSTNENRVKCWGRNTKGQVGQNSPTNTVVGSSATHMGNNLLFVSTGMSGSPTLGTTTVSTQGGTPIVVKSMGLKYATACAILDNGASANTISCWGDSAKYQAIPGNTSSNLMPVAMPSAVVPSGMEPEYVVTGIQHSCALGTSATGYKAYCWGTTTTTAPQIGLFGVNGATIQSASTTATSNNTSAITKVAY